MTEWSDWDAENAGFLCEPGVGLTMIDHVRRSYGEVQERWLSWDEAVALHAWLTQKIAAEQRGDTKPTETLNAL